MPDRGALYIVVGGGHPYIKAAVRSAESLRRAMPNLPIAVAAHQPIDGPFDHHIPISEQDGYRAKIIGTEQTPFERTIMLDADTYVLTELDDAFQLLDRFDMALAHAPSRVAVPLHDVPASFPEFNTGVIAYRRTDQVQAVLRDWLREYDAMSGLNLPSKDQPAFRRVAYHTPGLQIAVLTPEFNQRFAMAGFINQPVRILHGWESDSGYRRVAQAMKTPPAEWNYRAVFIGRRVYDRDGVLVADFHGRRLRSSMRFAWKRVLRSARLQPRSS